jgi:hypothetical protein
VEIYTSLLIRGRETLPELTLYQEKEKIMTEYQKTNAIVISCATLAIALLISFCIVITKQKQAFLLSEYGIEAPFFVADSIDIRIDNNKVTIED